MINHEFDYAHVVSIIESNGVIQLISLVSSPITDLLQITPNHHIRLKQLQQRNPHRTRRAMTRCDLAVKYINIQNGILAHNFYQIPELDITKPDILFTAEAGSGDFTE